MRSNQHMKNRSMNSKQSLADLAQSANARTEAFNQSLSSSSASSDFQPELEDSALNTKDNSRKAYYKEFRKVIENADVILEVLDARDPLGTRAKHIERMVMEAGTNKKIILVLNKVDLVPKEVVEGWLKYLRDEFPTILFKASTQSQRRNLGQGKVAVEHASEGLLHTSECLGADSLINLLKNYSRSQDLKTSITVGVIGYPNVGKSSLINSLKRSKVCSIGSTPGVTKVSQEITLDKNIKLIDCPGIVFSTGKTDNWQDAAQVMLRNCIKVELLDDPITPVELILTRCQKQTLMLLYNIPHFSSTSDFLLHISKQRGKLKKGGVPDLEAAAKTILQDWNSGKIPYYTVPPKRELGGSASFVTGLSEQFDIGSIDNDLNKLKSQREMGVDFVAMASVENDDDIDMGSGDDEDMDDGESVDSQYDEMEADEMMDQDESVSSSVISIDESRIKSSKSKQTAQPTKKQSVLSSLEEELNPQANKSLRKQQKRKQKQAKKFAEKSAASGLEGWVNDGDEMMDDNYDFGEFAWTGAGSGIAGLEDDDSE
ncbi:P-loop containing nucleoside triphosphate hydrolase protein [Paraphysoderma sedebokerense]|nr:P-loop containing nucleoside triphosphate hydrolase protein [Paraphysoderma sedebokerense]